MADYRAHLARIDSLQPLKMPSLGDYDATMHPLAKA